MFSRRAIQERLDALAVTLDEKSLAELACRIDARGRNRLSAMWETVWLYALAAEGPFEHERPLPGGARPDFRFRLPLGGRELEVVGDITCVSDRGLHENNPVELFWNEFVRRVLSAKLDPNHFRYQIGHRVVGEWPNSRTVLTLPPRRLIVAFVKQHAVPFLRELVQSKPSKAKHSIRTDDANVTLSYDITQEFGGGGHASYNHLTAATKNPVFARLQEKEDQLRGAPAEAVRAVILCDAGCQAMRKDVFGNGWSADKIAGAFLRQTSVIDLVVLVSVEIHNQMDWHRRSYSISARIVGAPSALGTRRTIEAGAVVRDYLDRALKHLPTPVLDAHNAALRIDESSPGTGTLGVNMSDRHVRLSARVVLDLLAGKISAEQFQRTYGWHLLALV